MSGAAITLGVMARAPIPGRCKTRLARAIGAERAAGLYAAMLADRLAAISALPVARRVVLAAPEDDGPAALRVLLPAGWDLVVQRGADLGERLASAMIDARAGGPGMMCLVDSDSPTLPLARCLEGLMRTPATSEVVLGPCEDGGYYLIGTRRPEPGVFEGIPWSTSGVLAATRERCSALGLGVTELDPWYDIDEPEDLERLMNDAEGLSRAPRTAAFLRGDR
ncbi:MAG: glycosyltransferase [Thermoleophilia bacterium]|nr:glycosyltransferase [Thermoleophilia bacterium]